MFLYLGISIDFLFEVLLIVGKLEVWIISLCLGLEGSIFKYIKCIILLMVVIN